MPAPTLVTTVNLDTQPWAQANNIAGGTATKNYASTLSTQANDLIVAVQGGANSSTSGVLTTTTTGLTYTQRTAKNTTNFCTVNIATAPDDSGGTRTITLNRTITTADIVGGVVFQFRSHGGVGSVFTATDSVQTGDISCSANSSVVVLCTDWGATSGAHSWATINGNAPTSTGGVTGDGSTWAAAWAYWSDVGAAGTKTVTLSSPNFTTETFAAIEILAGAGGDGYATAWLKA